MSRKVPKRRKYRVTRRFYAVVLGTALVLVGVAFCRQEIELNKLQNRQTELQMQQADNELEKDKLTHMLEAAGTDEYIESIAREKLGWVKEGETRFVVQKSTQE